MCVKNEMDIDAVIDKIQESIDSFDETKLDEFTQWIQTFEEKIKDLRIILTSNEFDLETFKVKVKNKIDDYVDADSRKEAEDVLDVFDLSTYIHKVLFISLYEILIGLKESKNEELAKPANRFLDMLAPLTEELQKEKPGIKKMTLVFPEIEIPNESAGYEENFNG